MGALLLAVCMKDSTCLLFVLVLIASFDASGALDAQFMGGHLLDDSLFQILEEEGQVVANGVLNPATGFVEKGVKAVEHGVSVVVDALETGVKDIKNKADSFENDLLGHLWNLDESKELPTQQLHSDQTKPKSGPSTRRLHDGSVISMLALAASPHRKPQ